MSLKSKYPAVFFVVSFLLLFALFDGFNLLFFGFTTPGNHYSSLLANQLNYIQGLRSVLLACSKLILEMFGYIVRSNDHQLMVVGRGTIDVVYTCLGLGVISFFAAFVLAYPKPWKQRLIFLLAGIFCIELLNVLRFVVLVLFWRHQNQKIIDHHTIFNIIIYIAIAISLYFWVTYKSTAQK